MSQEHPSFENEFDREEIKLILLRAFQSAFEKHTLLGERGLEEVSKNQFGETALRMDIEAEEAVLESFSRDGIPVRVISEEHGMVNIGDPKFLAVLDGIDGTALYKKERNRGKYGTMIGLFQGTDPLYSDYLMGGVMQHATKRALVGIRERGAFAISGNQEQPIRTSGHSDFDVKTKIYIDEYFEINRKNFSEPLAKFNTTYGIAASLHYADVAEGLADFALECTRKGNLEIAAAYGLIREAGGVIVDREGADLGSQKYLAFGQKEHVPVITAATKELADKLIFFLRERERSHS